MVSDDGVDLALEPGADAHERDPRRTSRRASRASGGAIHAAGSRFVRSSCASVVASTVSFLTRAEEIALVASGWAM